MKRELSFSDGKSDKFWNIDVQGTEFTITYGRTGTAGQTQTKSFDDNAEAQTAADKLIAEKLKKGYVEGASASGSGTATATSASTPAKTESKKAVSTKEEAAPDETATQAPASEGTLASADWELEAPRTVRLDPRDWLWATWRPRTPEPWPPTTPKPFDTARALQQLSALNKGNQWASDWAKAKIAPVVSREEAHFWLTAMGLDMVFTEGVHHQRAFTARVVTPMQAREFDGKVDIEQVIKLADSHNSYTGFNNAVRVLLLRTLFSPLDVLDVLLRGHGDSAPEPSQKYYNARFIEDLCSGFRAYVLPYLSEAEVEVMRERLRPEVTLERWNSIRQQPTPNGEQATPIAFYLAAQLGLPAEMEAVAKSWADNAFVNQTYSYYGNAFCSHELIFGLGSAEAVNREMRRLGLKLQIPDHVRAWLAHTQWNQTDWVGESVVGLTSGGMTYNTAVKDVAHALTEVLALVEAPEAAPTMLHLLLESKAPRAAREWLEAHPAYTIQAFTPIASGRGKVAEAALEFLRSLKKRSGEAQLRAVTATLSEEDAARFQALVLDYAEKEYEPFTDADAPEAVREVLAVDWGLMSLFKTPWLHVSDLPPITYGARRLSDEQVAALLGALHKEKHPLTLAVKAGADAPSLDTFAWALFQRWLREGANSKDKWAMLALGQLGGDGCALKLTPLIRVWPGESQHQRAVTGLDCLRAIGTDTALMQINSLANKLKYKGLQARAVEAMEGIAADRGLSRVQLEDRVVPTYDLDERGTRLFDFGPRQFELVLDSDLKPSVREKGVKMAKVRPNLPAPNSKDDPALAEAALAEWKLLKKQIADVAKVQAVRLEQAMITGRRWTLDEFETLLAHHPLMTNLARLLVWEVASGNRRATFRVTEDGSYADEGDKAFDLSAGEWAHVGIVHLLGLPTDEARAWGELFSDYEIVPPFAQIGRATYALEADEAQGNVITRFKDTKIQPETLNFTLEKFDWERGPALDGGWFHEHYKYFPSSDATACVDMQPGLGIGWREGWEPQTVANIYFLPGHQTARHWGYPTPDKGMPLRDIDPVALSEVLKDVSEIIAKGEIK